MSFILDALRKSEHERQRQRQTTPDFANFQPIARRPRLPTWTWVVGGLLLVNLVAVVVLVLRGERQTEAAETPTAVAAAPTVSNQALQSPVATTLQPAPAQQAAAQPIAPLEQQPAAVASPPNQSPVDESVAASQPTEASPEPQLRDNPPAAAQEEIVPSIHELNLTGANALPELHLDIHVYSKRPAERFVFINMRKYKEGSETPEGIAVERITADGAVLNRNGTRFLLPRQ